MPITMAIFVVSALSVIGIPPTCGFFSKWYLLLGAIDEHQWFFVVVLLASSLIHAILFFRVIEIVYFSPSGEPKQDAEAVVKGLDEAPLSALIPMILLALGILLLGMLSGKIISVIIQFAIPKSL